MADTDADALRRENMVLRQQVAALEAQLRFMQEGVRRLPSLVRSTSVISYSGSDVTVDVSPEELERMHRVFDRLDVMKSGTVSASDVVALFRGLGEPVTEDEANEFVSPASAGPGLCFEEFVVLWNEIHGADELGSRKGTWHSSRFKFLMARVELSGPEYVVTEEDGACPSLEYRVHFFVPSPEGPQIRISPWHDIPLRNADRTYNVVVEIPKWSRKKFEIATGEPFNPIKQDTKNGALREYNWGDMMFNYGAFPQTWEDPHHVSEGTGAHGDNDPLDAVEIGSRSHATGSVLRVKVLGVLAMIDSGQTDWKVLVVDVTDPFAAELHDVGDVETRLPGLIKAVRTWFQLYKAPTINVFGFDGAARDREFAESVVDETHAFWKALVEERGRGATV